MDSPETGSRAGIVACVSLALAGMAGGRVISAAIERPGFRPWLYCGIEATAANLNPKHRLTPQRLSFLEHPPNGVGAENLYLETDLERRTVRNRCRRDG